MIYHKFQKQSKKIFFAALIYLVVFAANLLDESIPDEIYAIKGEENEIHFSVPVTVEKKEESVPVFFHQTKSDGGIRQSLEYRLSCKFLNLIPVKEVSVHVVEKSYVMPCGMPVGIYTKTKGILIIGTGKVTSSDGLVYEPADQIVKSGDYIMTVNGKEISEKEDLVRLVNDSQGDAVVLGILRDGEPIELKIKPAALKDGSYKLGIWVRDDMAGVGTLTYISPDMKYGALGHPVSDGDTGSMIRLSGGKIYSTDIVGIVKGENGAPGELTGVINYKDENCLGTINENTRTGIYGDLVKLPEEMEDAYVEVCMKQDIRKGAAYILSALDGNVQQYQIVATGDTVAECEQGYLALLSQNGVVDGDAGLSGTETAEGAVAEIRSAVLDGNTVYFIRLAGSDMFYSISAVDQQLAVILNEGDRVTVTYRPGEGSILDGVELTLR